MDIGKFFDKLLWVLMIFVGGYVGAQIQSASTGIGELNQKMAVVISKMDSATKSIDDHEIRIRVLEEKMRGIRLSK